MLRVSGSSLWIVKKVQRSKSLGVAEQWQHNKFMPQGGKKETKRGHSGVGEEKNLNNPQKDGALRGKYTREPIQREKNSPTGEQSQIAWYSDKSPTPTLLANQDPEGKKRQGASLMVFANPEERSLEGEGWKVVQKPPEF